MINKLVLRLILVEDFYLIMSFRDTNEFLDWIADSKNFSIGVYEMSEAVRESLGNLPSYDSVQVLREDVDDLHSYGEFKGLRIDSMKLPNGIPITIVDISFHSFILDKRVLIG